MSYNSKIDPRLFINQTPEDDFRYGVKETLKGILRTTATGVIASFDAKTQRAKVQLTVLRKKRIDTGMEVIEEEEPHPLLLDVPVQMPSAGGYAITLPVKRGDECIVLFTERGIESWKTHGGYQSNTRNTYFNFNDAICIVGISSLPRKINNYKTNAAQFRGDEGWQCISLEDNGDINIHSPNAEVIVTCKTAIVNAPQSWFSGNVTISGNLLVEGETTCNKTITSQVGMYAPTFSGTGGGGGSMTIGSMTVTGDATIGGIGYKGHVHVGNGAGNKTSPPQG